MFRDVFDAIEANFHVPTKRLSLEQQREIVGRIFACLSNDAEPLLGAARAILGDDIYNNSNIAFEYSVIKPDQDGLLDPPIRIGEMYVRPENGLCDISLNFSVARGHRTGGQVFLPAVDLELEIRDLSAKEAFGAVYKDYRAQINRLLEQGKVSFFTSYCSGVAGKAKSNKISAKLDDYFSDAQADCWFSLGLRCSIDTSYADAIRGFLALSLLYIACRAGLAGKSSRPLFERNLAKVI